MPSLGRLLIISGLVLIGIGLLLNILGKIPFLGKLPGDIVIQKQNFSFYFPLTTCILLSLLLTLAFWIFSRR